MTQRAGSIVIESVEPQLDGGKWAVKRVVGDRVTVTADLFKEGHDVLVAVVRYRQIWPERDATPWAEVPMKPRGNDAWDAEFTVERNGRYVFTIEAWPDQYRTWASELKRKVDVGRDVKSELLEGAALLRGAAERAAGVAVDRARFEAAAQALVSEPQAKAVELALDPGLIHAAAAYPDRSVATRYEKELPLFVDREKARFGTWYEFFPRSTSDDPKRHGTFKDAEKLLPYVAELGFDIVYLPPIHPIGRTARKGKNNSLTAQPDDVGSPWAIGASEGGHKSVHPQLGTLDDFKAFVQRANALGIEVALDLAFQCSPDHPYVKEHPEWFNRRPDGTIKTAENPPKRYEDIVNFDWMGPGRETLWPELKSVVMHWVNAGVKIFRVDNPHTKPLPFWAWLIPEVQRTNPEVVFLSEAFTRPKVMKALCKLGFSQTYTYFTWRNFKHELEEYLTEITRPPVADYYRGNLWPNTPDILPELLQYGGPPAFRLRYVLAATLSSSCGIYSGYELCEGRAHHGEEYLDSEKYQLVAWDRDRPGNIKALVAKVNRLRKTHRALQLYSNLEFYRCRNERVLFYGKRTPDGTDVLLVAVNLDPYSAHEAVLEIPIEQLGISPDENYQVHELLTDERALWQGSHAQVRLTPENPAVIFQLLRFKKTEASFDYYG